MTSLAVMRVALPVLSLGLLWVLMCSPRDDDTADVKAKRAAREANRRATWVITPSMILVKLGVLAPGEGQSATEAQQRHRVSRMVHYADRIAMAGNDRKAINSRRTRRAKLKLRRLLQSASPQMIAEARRRALQAAGAEVLIVPSSSTIDALTTLCQRQDVALATIHVDSRIGDLLDLVGDQADSGRDPNPDQVDQVTPMVGDQVTSGHPDQDPTPGKINGTALIFTDLPRVDTDDPDAGGPDVTARPQDDDLLLTWYHDQLMAEFETVEDDPRPSAKVTVYRAGQITRTDRRQSERLLAAVAVERYEPLLALVDDDPNQVLDAKTVAELCHVAAGPAEKIIRRFRDQRANA